MQLSWHSPPLVHHSRALAFTPCGTQLLSLATIVDEPVVRSHKSFKSFPSQQTTKIQRKKKRNENTCGVEKVELGECKLARQKFSERVPHIKLHRNMCTRWFVEGQFVICWHFLILSAGEGTIAVILIQLLDSRAV